MNLAALFKLSYGVYIVTSTNGSDKINGQIANTAIQTTSEPPGVSVTINKNNLTHAYISQSGVFAVSVLERDTPLHFIGQFGFKSGRDIDKFENVNYKKGETGAPVVTDHTVAYYECKVVSQHDVGTHTIFVGQVVAAEILTDSEPMTYAYYHQVKRGTTPKNAPSYVEVKKEEKTKMDKYECTVCGYTYDPAEGDPDSQVPAGTPWEKLPDNWVCPICGAGKSDFKKIG